MLPACPFSTCVTPVNSRNSHPEGEPCIYVTAVTFIPFGEYVTLYLIVSYLYGSQLVSSQSCGYYTMFHTRSCRKYQEHTPPSSPLSTKSHKICTPTSEESSEAQKEKHGETIEWVRLVYLLHIASYHLGLCVKNAASAAASCSVFRVSNSLTTLRSPGNSEYGT